MLLYKIMWYMVIIKSNRLIIWFNLLASLDARPSLCCNEPVTPPWEPRLIRPFQPISRRAAPAVVAAKFGSLNGEITNNNHQQPTTNNNHLVVNGVSWWVDNG